MPNPDVAKVAEGLTEREAIVAWLREMTESTLKSSRQIGLAPFLRSAAVDRAYAYRVAADSIERGDHLVRSGR